MDQDLEKLISEAVNEILPPGMPLSGELKYLKQEPGGTMMAVNVDELQNCQRGTLTGGKSHCEFAYVPPAECEH